MWSLIRGDLRNRCRAPLAVYFIALIGSQLACASDVTSAPLQLCTTEWRPFAYLDEEGLPSGASVAIQRDVFARLNEPISINVTKWAQCLKSVRANKIVAAFDHVKTSESLVGEVPSGVFPLHLYTLKSERHVPFVWQTFHGVEVGMVGSYTYTPKIRNFKKWIRDYGDDDDQVVRKLMRGRYDYALLDVFVARELGHKYELKWLILEPAVDVAFLYVDFAEPYRHILERHTKVMQEMRDDGSLDRHYLHYGLPPYTQLMRRYRMEIDNSDKSHR